MPRWHTVTVKVQQSTAEDRDIEELRQKGRAAGREAAGEALFNRGRDAGRMWKRMVTELISSS